ncbi:MAG: hypothetical protein WCJ71_06285 [Candidatus Omnitrophota bacterium]
MAQPDSSLTPEKRLLDLIEEPSAHQKDIAAGAKKVQQGARFSSEALKERFLKTSNEFYERIKASFGIKELNRILRFLVILLALVFFVVLLIGVLDLKKDIAGSIGTSEPKMLDLPPVTETSKEAEPIESWDLGKMFMPYSKRAEDARKLEKEQSSKLVDMTKTLKLTGISYNPTDPKKVFCMIEDVQKGITTFLREGDPIGLLKVSKIMEDHAVLSLGEDTVEIR